jgi:hypothetical protein
MFKIYHNQYTLNLKKNNNSYNLNVTITSFNGN